MSDPEFSFITPTYNCGRFIHRCYWSLCQQTVQDWEWVVVDDASTDGTGTLIQQLNDPRIVYQRLNKTEGPGVARNHAMSKAQGSWLVIQDMDDFSFPRRLEQARHAREEGYDFMSSYLALIDSGYAFRGLRGWQIARYPHGFSHGTLCGQADILRKVGYPSYLRGEDQTMVLHLANKYRGLHVSEPLYVYHENASIRAKKAMLGHYCMVWQFRDLIRQGVLRPALGVYRIMVISIVKMIILALVFVPWPSLYARTFSRRSKVRSQGSDSLTIDQWEFLRQAAQKFPVAIRKP